MGIEKSITFNGGVLDRAAHLRSHQDRIDELSVSNAARFVLFWRGKILVKGESPIIIARLSAGSPVMKECRSEQIFLGFEGETPIFAADMSTWEPDLENSADMHGAFDDTVQTHPAFADDERFSDLRPIMAKLMSQDAEMAAMGRALWSWHHSHGFCSKCGAKSVMSSAGWQRQCPACSSPHFPRTDPVVIMLITHGNNVLLGRSPGWPQDMYSLLAGFVEPGETVENAVRREVMEESGIEVGAVSYVASQPWPFPASLMLACQGEALSTDITLDPVELEAARWVSREEVAQAYAGRHPELTVAREGAIARTVLQHWLMDTLKP